MDTMDSDTLLRLLAATGCGVLIGISHDLRGKPAGTRTLGLVALGAALLTAGTTQLPMIAGHPDAVSRVIQGAIQGIVTGIGFLGAGAIMRGPNEVRGLTTAASVWVTAVLGIICMLSPWPLIGIGLLIAVVLSAFAHPLENWLERRRKTESDQES
ncbi:MgtC/SapB family protein [Altererythrobacter xixiisoli]|uniref:Protein MgtC n=2 Tax=Croceibacterium xixiisoli TaxID=1476466 RepID=A0A6I4TY29_9SPHN|nr:MgtC/SapB family protein [Croceibacterium xixiisoli]